MLRYLYIYNGIPYPCQGLTNHHVPLSLTWTISTFSTRAERYNGTDPAAQKLPVCAEGTTLSGIAVVFTIPQDTYQHIPHHTFLATLAGRNAPSHGLTIREQCMWNTWLHARERSIAVPCAINAVPARVTNSAPAPTANPDMPCVKPGRRTLYYDSRHD